MRGLIHAAAGIAPVLVAILMAEPVEAACTASGTTLTCTGDNSGGVTESSAAVTTIDIHTLTTDIGNNGFRFSQTGGLDLTIAADLGTFKIALDPPNTSNPRNGFEITGDGGVSGFLTGDITGPTRPDYSLFALDDNTSTNYAGLGLDVGGTIDFTHTGVIDVSKADLDLHSVSAGSLIDLATGRFAALRAESVAGDVTFVNDGDISVDGGHRTVTAISSNDLGTRALQFRNAFTEHYGAIFQGAGDLDFTQNGNISVTGGGATTYSQVVDHTAEAKSDPGRSGGIYIPTYTSLNGVAHDFPIFDGLKIDMTGNVTVSGDAASSTALSQTTTAGSNNNIAEADNSGYTSAYGMYVDNGVDLDISLDGDVSVAGANSSAHAEAYFGTGTPDGPVYALARAQSATGLWVSGSSKASGPTTLTLDYTGTMTITGGDASAEAHGTSTATINTLDDVPSSVPPIPSSSVAALRPGFTIYGTPSSRPSRPPSTPSSVPPAAMPPARWSATTSPPISMVARARDSRWPSAANRAQASISISWPRVATRPGFCRERTFPPPSSAARASPGR